MPHPLSQSSETIFTNPITNQLIAMNQQAQQAKIEKILNTLVNYSEGVMSRKQWIELKFKNGGILYEDTKPRIKWNRIKYNRMSNRDEQIEYEKKCDEKIISYNLKKNENECSFYEITKTEFDYFNSLKK
jgi:hypothetical protein